MRRSGRSLSVITYGMMVHESLKAAEEVAGEGIDVEVLDLRTLSPLDKPAILATVRRTHKVVIVHEDSLTGGLGGEIAGIIGQEAFDVLDGPITRVAAPDAPATPFNGFLEDLYLPNAEKIAKAIRELAAYSGNHRDTTRRATSPSPGGEGRGEGGLAINAERYLQAPARPHPSPLPQEREWSIASFVTCWLAISLAHAHRPRQALAAPLRAVVGVGLRGDGLGLHRVERPRLEGKVIWSLGSMSVM